MDRTPRDLVIDARPRGPRGPLAAERVQGRCVLAHLLDVAAAVSDRPVTVHAPPDDHLTLSVAVGDRSPGRFVLVDSPTPVRAAVLRADRLYDASRLRRAMRRGKDPESAVIWRLDRPQALVAAGDELTRRQTYQPLGRYWAIEPARRLARALAPTRVRPNAVTLAAASLMLLATGLVAFVRPGLFVNAAASLAMALALVLDTADGHLARLQGTTSDFGRWLDAWLDELCDMALHAAVAWSAFVRTGAPGWLLTGMLYAMGKYVFLVGTTGPGGEGSGTPTTQTRTRSVVRDAVHLAGHADVRWHLWIGLASVGRLDAALVAYALYFPARTLLGAARKASRHG